MAPHVPREAERRDHVAFADNDLNGHDGRATSLRSGTLRGLWGVGLEGGEAEGKGDKKGLER